MGPIQVFEFMIALLRSIVSRHFRSVLSRFAMTLKRQRDLLVLRLAGLLHPHPRSRQLPPPSFPSRSRTDSKVPPHLQIRFRFR